MISGLCLVSNLTVEDKSLIEFTSNSRAFAMFDEPTLCFICFVSFALRAVYLAFTNRVPSVFLFWLHFYFR